MNTEGIFSSLRQSATGLSSGMRRLQAIAENIANAESVPDENGKIYQRKVLVQKGSKSGGPNSFGNQLSLKMNRTESAHINGSKNAGSSNGAIASTGNAYEVVNIDDEKMVHNPSHPRADENGYVRMPNINVVEEMVDMMSATRSYEANVSVMDATKSMIKKTLEI